MTSTAVCGYSSRTLCACLGERTNEREMLYGNGRGRGRKWLSRAHYRQLRWGTSICFGARRVTLRLSELSQRPPWPSQAESHRRIHQHMFLDTFQKRRQHIQITQSIPRTPHLNFRALGRNISRVNVVHIRSFLLVSLLSTFLPDVSVYLPWYFRNVDEIISSF